MDKLNVVTEFIKNNKRNIYIAVAVLAVFVVIFFIYKMFQKSAPVAPPIEPANETSEMEPTGNPDQFGSGKEPTKVVIFYAPWCPHCKNVMDGDDSIWNQLKRKYKQKKDIMIDQVDCEEKPELATKFGIKGFPTVMKIKEDKMEQFEGEMSIEALDGFIGSE